MADSYIQVAADGGGKKLDTDVLTVGANTVHRERIVLADPSDTAGLAKVKNANPASTDYGSVVREIPSSSRRSDTFTTPANGATVTPPYPFETFSIQVIPTGAVTAWTVVLEGSIDAGVSWTTILTHTEVIGSGIIVFSGATSTVVDLFRATLVDITLGAGTNVISTILGK